MGSDKENDLATVNMRASTLTFVLFVSVYKTNSFPVMVAFMQYTVHWFCFVWMIVHCTVGDLRPSAGARRRDSRAIQKEEYADIDGCHRCFLFRNDGENQYSVVHIILFDGFSESESIQHHRDDIKHFARVLCAHPEHINRKEKFTQFLQVYPMKIKKMTVSGI